MYVCSMVRECVCVCVCMCLCVYELICIFMNICMFVLMLLNCGVGEDSRVPWRARRSNQSILKEINPEYSLEELMLKLKLQHFGHLLRRGDSLEMILMLGKIKGRIRRG